MRHLYIYRFRVPADRVDDFVRAYCRDGTWADLFRRAAGYLGTELLRDQEHAFEFLTIDTWESAEQYAAFREQWRVEYERLDRECMALTEEETYVGHFKGS